ncbi:hypothetical protein [Streptomyces sp. Isolate_219]|nr:hypothetical protein [Streptomyces sp. Isolate_219]MCR8577711.1 hypothetical protein [Streptomyces sp. Isolate_219]
MRTLAVRPGVPKPGTGEPSAEATRFLPVHLTLHSGSALMLPQETP